VPALDPQEASGLITGSEHNLKKYAKSEPLTAKDVKKSIEGVLQNPDLNANDVDTDMLALFANTMIIITICSGDLEIIYMHKEGDGAHKLECFKRVAEKVLRELMPHIRLAGCQHLSARSNWILMETDCLPVMQMDLSLFNWRGYG
jgi:hypothetical protein